MGGFAAGLAGAIGDHLHEQHLINIQQQVETKRNLLDNYKTLLSDPHLQDVHGDIIQAMLGAAGTEPGKIQKLLKPGSPNDPTQWQVLAQRRAAGQVPSPVNQGQNPTMIPAAPVQHDGTPGGQSQQAPSWADATSQMGQMQAAQQPPQSPSAPPPPSVGLAIPPPPGQPPSPTAADQSQQLGNMNAQQLGALPPVAGSPAPNGSELSTPASASASAGPMTPPPPPAGASAGAPSFQYGPGGSLPHSELVRRQIDEQAQLDRAKYGTQNEAEFTKQAGLSRLATQQDQEKINNHINTLKTLGVWQTLNSREKAAVATGIQSLGNTPRQLGIPGNVPGKSAQDGQLDISGNAVDPNGIYHLRPNPATGEVDWIPQAIKKNLQWAADEDNPQQLKLYEVNPYNPQDKTPVKDIKKYDAALIPVVKNATQWKSVQQTDGSTVLVPVSVSSSSTKTPTGSTAPAPPKSSAGPSGPAAPPAPKATGPAGSVPPPPPPATGTGNGSTPNLPKGSFVAGGKSLTPEQRMKSTEQLGALNSTIELTQRIQKNMPLLNSLISAKKIEMQVDPQQGIVKAFINRNVPLSPQEEQMAADAASLMEHINTLRGPLGATGFRGHEAFGALQAQRGQLLANPGVTSKILANTLQALNRTRKPIADELKKAGQAPEEPKGDVTEIERGPDGKLRVKR